MFLAVTIAAALGLMNRANVLAEQKIQSPLEGHADLFVQPGQFTQVNRAPQPPGKETGEIESENPRYASPASDGRQQPNGPERKGFQRLSVEGRDDIVRDNSAFTNGVLCRPRGRLPRLPCARATRAKHPTPPTLPSPHFPHIPYPHT